VTGQQRCALSDLYCGEYIVIPTKEKSATSLLLTYSKQTSCGCAHNNAAHSLVGFSKAVVVRKKEKKEKFFFFFFFFLKKG
jgi:hypothetical protein